MHKQILCTMLSLVFLLCLHVGCSGQPPESDKSSDTAITKPSESKTHISETTNTFAVSLPEITSGKSTSGDINTADFSA